MAQLPQRTTANTAQDHVGDHDELHRVHNLLEGEDLPARVDALESGASGALVDVFHTLTPLTLGDNSEHPFADWAAWPNPQGSAASAGVTTDGVHFDTATAGFYMTRLRITVSSMTAGFGGYEMVGLVLDDDFWLSEDVIADPTLGLVDGLSASALGWVGAGSSNWTPKAGKLGGNAVATEVVISTATFTIVKLA